MPAAELPTDTAVPESLMLSKYLDNISCQVYTTRQGDSGQLLSRRNTVVLPSRSEPERSPNISSCRPRWPPLNRARACAGAAG